MPPSQSPLQRKVDLLFSSFIMLMSWCTRQIELEKVILTIPAALASSVTEQRQRWLPKAVAVCLFGNTNTNISVVVLEMNVKLVVESLIPELVPQRSMQTTMLFIKDPESSIGSLQHAAKVAHCRPLCQAIKKCVEYINDNGGFTIMGMITRDPRRKSRCLE